MSVAGGSIDVRPLDGDDMARFLSLDRPTAGAGFGPPGRDFLATVADGHYRPGWVWVAERDGEVVARAAFWGGPKDERPYALDWFDIAADVAADVADRVQVGARLLGEAFDALTSPTGERPELHVFLPADWRDRPDVRAPANERIEAAQRAGLEIFVERLRVEWLSPSADGPDDESSEAPGDTTSSGRLVMRPVGSEDEWLAALERVAEGTLDAYTRRDVEQSGVAAAAREQLEWMAWMPAPREWWRLAMRPDGSLVGVVMPTKNYDAAVLGYLGVVPEHRGQGFAGELVDWATAFLASQGIRRIVADTDTGNTPMATAFARSGYAVVARRVVMI